MPGQVALTAVVLSLREVIAQGRLGLGPLWSFLRDDSCKDFRRFCKRLCVLSFLPSWHSSTRIGMESCPSDSPFSGRPHRGVTSVNYDFSDMPQSGQQLRCWNTLTRN